MARSASIRKPRLEEAFRRLHSCLCTLWPRLVICLSHPKNMHQLTLKWLANFILLAAGALFQSSAWSQTFLAKPSGQVILTVSGSIASVNQEGKAQFDAAMIDALPAHVITTKTPWYKQATTFSGPRLSEVLAVLGAKGTTLEIKALNDYTVSVPFADATTFQPILARRMDSKVLNVRDKGPLFLVYPFDARPELKNDIYYSRSIWQISSIVIR